MRLILIIFLFNFFSYKIFCDNYETILREGMELAYNFEFKSAEEKYFQLLKIDNKNPQGYLALSNIYVWQYLTDNDNSTLEKFEYYSGLTQSKSKEILAKDESNFIARYCYTTIQGYKTLVFLMSKKYTAGIWAAKECIYNSKDIKKTEPKFYDIYLWSGLFKFIFSQIPTSIQYLLKIAGIEANFAEGLTELQLAADKGYYNKVEAKYFLSQIYSVYLEDENKTSSILNDLTKDYPKNYLFSYSLASQLIKERKLLIAKNILEDLLSKTKNTYKKLNLLTAFLLGDVNFFSGNYNKAVSYYDNFLQSAGENEFKNTAYFRLGMSYAFLNDIDKMNDNFKKGAETDAMNEEGEYYKAKCNLYVNRKITNNELQILKIENEIKSADFSSARQSLTEFMNKYSDKESYIKANYYFGLINFYEKKFSDAKNYFLISASESIKSENWMKPFSQYFISRVLLFEKNYESSINLLRETLKLNNFYFERSLKYKLEYLLQLSKDKNNEI